MNSSDLSQNSSDKTPVNIVWFKRDLRLKDNQALTAALQESAAAGIPVLMIYIFEPSLILDSHYDIRHWRFVMQSLVCLNKQLQGISEDRSDSPDIALESTDKIHIFHNEVKDVFEILSSNYIINTIFSHQEIGLRITFDRDIACSAYFKLNGIRWIEIPTNGIQRAGKNQDRWTDLWKETMNAPQFNPDFKNVNFLVLRDDLLKELKGDILPIDFYEIHEDFQFGGELSAQVLLYTFLNQQIFDYSESLSKPLESRSGCSRLSPYLAWGCVSTRQVFQAADHAKEKADAEGLDIRHFSNFMPRLKWQGQFMQQFESQDEMEFTDSGGDFSSLQKQHDLEKYQNWKEGKTGYPLIDALMRCLKATGYINFRMRALLVSFLTHHLFQDWKEGAKHLASYFTDFEPGLHYAQIQMQSGMGKQKTVRVYNPIKQSYDHDTEGLFIKMWVPELEGCSKDEIHEPWNMTSEQQRVNKVKLGVDYPFPIVDIVETGRAARTKLFELSKYK